MEASGPGGQPNTPAGWYANPSGPGQRYWDGTKWTDSYQQPQMPPKKKGGGSTVLKITLGVVLGGCLLIAGCVALLAAGVDEAEKEQDKTAITRQQFNQAKIGTTQKQIESEFGEPEDAQDFENEGALPKDQVSRSSCIYYNEKGKGLGEGDSYQFCFENGKLDSKNAY